MNEDGGGRVDPQGEPLALGIQVSEKVYQDFTLEVTNPGGHWSLPPPDNAIYQLVSALEAVMGLRVWVNHLPRMSTCRKPYPSDVSDEESTAMDRYGNLAPGARTSVADPDERVERMVAANTPQDRSHGKPAKSVRNILRDDPLLREAYARPYNKQHAHRSSYVRPMDYHPSDRFVAAMSVTRRTALVGLTTSATLLSTPAILRAQQLFTAYPFRLGVAAGEPAADGFVIWTRRAPDPLERHGGMPMAPIAVDWQVASDDRFTTLVAKGRALARPELAHSIHVEVGGLLPDRPY